MTHALEAEHLAASHDDLLLELRRLLGWRFQETGRVYFERTKKGRSILRLGQTTYFREAGRLYAGRVFGGRAEFAQVPMDGAGELWRWARAGRSEAVRTAPSSAEGGSGDTEIGGLPATRLIDDFAVVGQAA